MSEEAKDTEADVKHFQWDDGLPTKPHVDALLKAFPPDEIKPGKWRATDEQIMEHVGRADAIRYRTIYSVWRNRLRNDHGVIIYRDKTVGFFCPTPEEVFAMTHPCVESAGRKIGKQLRHVAVVKPENELQRTVQEHQGRLLSTTKRELKKARMNVLPPSAAAERPKIEPPKSAAGTK